jgi:DNA-binding response OmpR family regulator
VTSTLLLDLRVLLVEDDPIIALGVEDMLAGAGAIMVGPAHTVSQALALIEGSTIDVAVLDYRLETETASPVAARLTAMRVPYLFYTSSRGQPERDHPGVPILEKPNDADKLVAAIAALTNRSEECR